MIEAALAEEKTTFCRICENQCGLLVTVENDRITRVRPDAAHVTTRGYACIKGLTMENVRASPDRVTTPLKKVSGKFVPIGWEQAFDEIGEKIRSLRARHGDDSVGIYFGNPISFSIVGTMFANGFAEGLNTGKVFNSGSLDCNNKFVVSQQMYGSPMALTFPDIECVSFLMLIGSNPAVSKGTFIHLPSPAKQLQEIVARGGRVIHVNPRRTESAKAAGEHVFIRPDTDVFFLLGFLNELLKNDAMDHARIASTMTGFEQLRAVAAPWSAERQANVTGIPAERLRELVCAYLVADGAALYAATGVNQGSNGTLAFWILEAINAVSGNLDRRGGSLMGRGIIDFAKVAARTKYRKFRSRIGNTQNFLGALPMGLLADEILTPGEDRLRAMFIVSGNPQICSTNSAKTEKALAALELLVCLDMFRSETAEHAHYILPGLHFSERPDLPFFFFTFCGLMPEPWFQYTDRLVKAPGECRDEVWILSRLAQACAAPMFGSRIFQGLLEIGAALRRIPKIGNLLKPVSERLLELVSLFGRQGRLSTLRRHPHGIRLPANQGGSFLGKRLLTADGKLSLAPPDLIALAAQRLETSHALALENRQKFLLMTKRERYTHNSWSHNDPLFVKGSHGTNYLYMNPEDAERLGLSEGRLACVESKVGKVIAPIAITDDIMPRSVALPHGWGHQSAAGLSVASQTSGVNANLLAADGPEAIEPLSGMAQFTGIVVSVSAADSTSQSPARI
jgi:anaerobic selenocysteine-containing dehydrogenase